MTNCRRVFTIFLVGLICYLYGIYMFAIGFMPLKTTKLVSASVNDIPKEPSSDVANSQFNVYRSHFKKTAFVLIDALRSDFVIPTEAQSNLFKEQLFQHVNNFINSGAAIAFTSKVFSPTVTLPRIKTLLSGTLPSFMDMLVNFNAQKMNEDNLLSQAYFNNLKVVFYGDNTWISLFPNEFHRQEGTHSFYVTDFEEVDNNVTRNLNNELKKSDWDMMILHYLGVDHIGHAFGPRSSLMPNKLKEMDGIIFDIYNGLQKKNETNLIVICGDHGMTGGGSHGGNSVDELHTPLIFVSTKAKHVVSNLPKYISQVDIAVTLSVLLGLPIPSNSMGMIIPEVLEFSEMTSREILYAAYYNLQQLCSFHKAVFGTSELLHSSTLQEIFKRHSKWLKRFISKDIMNVDSDYHYLLNIYLENIKKIKNALMLKSSGYNNEFMLIGIAIMWTTLSLFMYGLTSNNRILLSIRNILICFSTVNFIFYNLLRNFIESLCYTSLILNTLLLLKKLVAFILSKTTLEKFYVFFMFVSVLGLGSSSFVEEEHQIWYFMSTTMLLLLFCSSSVSPFRHILRSIALKSHNKQLPLKVSDKYSSFKFTAFVNSQLSCFIPIVLLALNRLFRSWNQTGNKWAHLRDISDWLVKEENSAVLHIVTIMSLLVIFVRFCDNMQRTTVYVIASSIIWLYIYRCQNFIIKLICNLLNSDKEAVFGPCILYGHSIFILLIAIIAHYQKNKLQSSVMKRAKHFIACIVISWTLISVTICRIQNMPLIAGTFLQEFLLNEVTWKQRHNTFSNMIPYLIMSMSSFYYNGNSNSLSTIDVYAGYIGLTNYHPILAGFLILTNTYSTYVLWLLLAFYRIYCGYHSNAYNVTYKDNVKADVTICFRSMIFYRICVLSLYLIIVYTLRYHLFILSVFAPKFFYEVVHSLVCIVVVFVVFLIGE